MAPDCVVKVVFGLAGQIRVVDALDPQRVTTAVSLVNPPRVTACVGDHSGVLHGITVAMIPSAAYRLFAIPLGELAGQPIDLAELWGDEALRLTERLAGLPTWAARFALVEQALIRRWAVGPSSSAEVVAAWELLEREAGALSMGSLTALTGWSARRLQRRFTQQVGLAPQAAAGVLRLRHAVRLQAAGSSWTHAAIDAGYYDQPHFNHTFRALMGCTPQGFSTARATAPDAREDIAGRATSVLLDRR
jgi:AraC-like DNA-binding protein